MDRDRQIFIGLKVDEKMQLIQLDIEDTNLLTNLVVENIEKFISKIEESTEEFEKLDTKKSINEPDYSQVEISNFESILRNIHSYKKHLEKHESLYNIFSIMFDENSEHFESNNQQAIDSLNSGLDSLGYIIRDNDFTMYNRYCVIEASKQK